MSVRHSAEDPWQHELVRAGAQRKERRAQHQSWCHASRRMCRPHVRSTGSQRRLTRPVARVDIGHPFRRAHGAAALCVHEESREVDSKQGRAVTSASLQHLHLWQGEGSGTHVKPRTCLAELRHMHNGGAHAATVWRRVASSEACWRHRAPNPILVACPQLVLIAGARRAAGQVV